MRLLCWLGVHRWGESATGRWARCVRCGVKPREAAAGERAGRRFADGVALDARTVRQVRTRDEQAAGAAPVVERPLQTGGIIRPAVPSTSDATRRYTTGGPIHPFHGGSGPEMIDLPPGSFVHPYSYVGGPNRHGPGRPPPEPVLDDDAGTAPLGRCDRPPAGWVCSRRFAHPGPCAASPDPEGGTP